MVSMEAYYQKVLKKRFEEKKRNPLYSLRSFARHLGVSPAQLSQLISGRRPLTRKTAEKLVKRLSLSPIETIKFFESRDNSMDGIEKQHAPETILKDDEFALISDWYHLALLSYADTTKGRLEMGGLSQEFGIPYANLLEALSRLERLGYFSKKSDGTFTRTNRKIKTSTDIPSEAIRKFHRQSLRQAEEKLEEVPVAEREFTTLLLAANAKHLPEAKELIREFKRKMTLLLEDQNSNCVYTLSIQLYPTLRRKK